MATQGKNVTDSAWINIVSSLSLVVGIAYTLQNTGDQNIKLIEKATEPADSDLYHVITPNTLIPITIASGLGFWVKTFRNGSSNVVLTES